jgi:hypothetical protein
LDAARRLGHRSRINKIKTVDSRWRRSRDPSSISIHSHGRRSLPVEVMRRVIDEMGNRPRTSQTRSVLHSVLHDFWRPYSLLIALRFLDVPAQSIMGATEKR